MKTVTQWLFVALLLPVSASVFSATGPTLNDIQHLWAQINYRGGEAEDKVEAFRALLTEAQQLVDAEPEAAEPYIWLGIVQSSTAGAKGGLAALKYAKMAKKNFEKAMKINENALQGSAMTSLGVLYHKVPGWPIAFGSDKKAEMLLKHALSLNPDGIDPNYFYAEFLFDEGEYQQALEYANRAESAPARSDRPLADEGRHEEIAHLKQQIVAKRH